MATYNINPIFLSAKHWVLAKKGILLPPLRVAGDTIISAGHFTLAATPSGAPWLARVQAGSFVLDATPQASGYHLGIYRNIGHFNLAADLPLGAAFVGVPIIVGAFTLDSTLSGKYGLAVANAGFTLHANLSMANTFLGYFQTCGPFTLAPALSGDFERLIWWLEDPPLTAQLIFTCTLTGEEDNTTDIELPMSSFQYRLYKGSGRSAVTVVVPNAEAYAGQIADRSKGELVIRMGYKYEDGSQNLSEIARAGGLTLRYDQGARNSSATLSTSKQVTFSFDPAVPKKTDKIVTKGMLATGEYTFQIQPINGLFPGDDVELAGELFKVEQINVAIGERTHQMNLKVSPA